MVRPITDKKKKKQPKKREIELKFHKPKFVKPQKAPKEPKRLREDEKKIYSKSNVQEALSRAPLGQLREFVMSAGGGIQPQTTIKALQEQLNIKKEIDKKEEREAHLKELTKTMLDTTTAVLNLNKEELSKMELKHNTLVDEVQDIKESHEDLESGQIIIGIEGSKQLRQINRQIGNLERQISGKSGDIVEMTGGMASLQQSLDPSKLLSSEGIMRRSIGSQQIPIRSRSLPPVQKIEEIQEESKPGPSVPKGKEKVEDPQEEEPEKYKFSERVSISSNIQKFYEPYVLPSSTTVTRIKGEIKDKINERLAKTPRGKKLLVDDELIKKITKEIIETKHRSTLKLDTGKKK